MISKVTNYGGYQSYGQKPVTSLKTGQTALERDYYSQVSKTTEDPTFIQTHNRFQTLYNSTVSSSVAPEDYVSRPRQPCFDSTGRPRTQSLNPTASSQEQPKSTAHWKTNYQAEFHEKPDIGRGQRPEWSLHQAPHIVRMPADFYRSKYS